MRIAWLALVLLWGHAPAAAAVEARTPHFRVVTGLQPDIASAAAQELETVRLRYHSLGLKASRRVEPVTVVLFRDLLDLEAVVGLVGDRQKLTRAFHQRGADRDFIAMAWDAPGPPRVALAHEYAHQIFSPRDHPLWFREGVAEYLSHAESVGNVLRLGLMPPGFGFSLLNEAWIPLPDLLAARQGSPVLGHKNFAAQCWLIVHWLASRQTHLVKLSAGELEKHIKREGVDAVERQLQDHLRQPVTPLVVPVPSREDRGAAALRPLDEWELEYWVADLLREMNRPAEARYYLQRLDDSFPGRPELKGSLGAIEMDSGRYDRAERLLAAAVANGSTDPRTHYRYSLLLMRPVRRASAERARQAAYHAQLARQADPVDPKYLLTEAQALMLAGDGTKSAQLLAELAETPGWRHQAGVELEEIQRRKQRQLARLQPPLLSLPHLPPQAFDTAPPPVIDTPIHLPRRSTVPRARAARGSHRRAWPPPGTILLAGRINGVECRGAEKIVIVDSNPFRARLRIDGEPKLYFPPLKWKELPCDTRGWQVHAVYRPARGKNGVRGVLVALVF